MNTEAFRDKFRGTLLGGAIGDAIGAPFVGRQTVLRKTFEKYSHDPGRMHYTDDTHLTIVVAESLIDCRVFDGADLAAKLLRAVREEPWRSYAERPARIVEQIAQGVKWHDLARTVPALGGELTPPGPANCIAPAVLLHASDPTGALSVVTQIGAVFDEPGWPRDSAALHAAALLLLLRERPGAILDKTRFFRELRTQVRDATALAALKAVESLLPDAPAARVREKIQAAIPPPHEVPLALYAFLRCPESFAEAVLYGVTLGGATDTIGALAGSLAGAFLGGDLIPPVWRREVEGAALMRRLADSLLLLAATPAEKIA